MPGTPLLLERFLPSDTTLYAGPGEITRQYVGKMPLAALQLGGDQVPDETGDRMEVSP
jgi:hypothetical protein